MIIFDGTYRLSANQKEPGKSAYAWHIRIIDMSKSQPDIRHLKPIIIIAIPEGNGIFKTSCADSLGRKICRDFGLNVKNILWVERFSDQPEDMALASFRPKGIFGAETFYHITWRPLISNEIKAVRPFIPDIINTNTD